ncbi:retropepsin-like aspartic protease [Seonamhaeicola sp.]|uniref:retropepsin-like aspartic protease n=1 Tax=Seonamhaeicola sp. TaxID=1912245 RepID=UPI002636CAB8|nr:retropepsin-like aspartic protease [Seonamhaeicola sp.]
MGRIILGIFFYLSLTSVCHAQKSYFKTGKPSSKHYYTEITYEEVRGKIIIPVSIDGKVYRFLFDTGAPNLITSDLWKTIKSKKTRSLSVTDINQKKQRMDLITIQKLSLGNISFKNTGALMFNGKNNLVIDCFKVDGFIGSNLLRKSIIQIKPKEKRLILTNDPKKLDLNEEHASPLILVGNQSSPYINIKLKGDHSGNENLLFDTGASGFYDLCKKNYKTLEEKNIATVLSKGKGASSVGMFGVAEKSVQYRLKIPELTINNQIFTNVITTTGDDDNSRIGSDILKYGNVTLDFIKRKFYFTPFEANNDLDEKLFGFSPTIIDKKLVVGFVWDEALKDHIQFGDEIIEINSINYQDKEICDFITKRSIFKQNNTLNVVIKRQNGEKKTLTIQRK